MKIKVKQEWIDGNSLIGECFVKVNFPSYMCIPLTTRTWDVSKYIDIWVESWKITHIHPLAAYSHSQRIRYSSLVSGLLPLVCSYWCHLMKCPSAVVVSGGVWMSDSQTFPPENMICVLSVIKRQEGFVVIFYILTTHLRYTSDITYIHYKTECSYFELKDDVFPNLTKY